MKQYITYKVKVIQEGVMRSFNYEKRMMMCGYRVLPLSSLRAGCSPNTPTLISLHAMARVAPRRRPPLSWTIYQRHDVSSSNLHGTLS